MRRILLLMLRVRDNSFRPPVLRLSKTSHFRAVDQTGIFAVYHLVPLFAEDDKTYLLSVAMKVVVQIFLVLAALNQYLPIRFHLLAVAQYPPGLFHPLLLFLHLLVPFHQ